MQKRWQMAVVLLITVVIAFLDRLNVTYIIVALSKENNWSEAEIGVKGGQLTSFFYLAYGVSNMLLSPLGAKMGARASIMLIIVLWSVFTVMGAWFSQFFGLMLLSRVLLGLSEGLHYPMMNQLSQRWFPLQERSRGNGIWTVGIFIALILGPFLLIPLIREYGWRNMFYVLAVLGMAISLPLVYFFVYDSPEQHPRISAEELAYIQQGVEPNPENSSTKQSLLKLFQSPLLLLALAASALNNMVAHGLLSWMPTYFVKARGLGETELMYALAIPYACSIGAVWFWSFLGDKTSKRILLACIGFFFTGISLVFALQLETLPTVTIFFCFTIIFITSYVTAEYAVAQKIIPQSMIVSGVGVYNGISILAGGTTGPAIVGWVIAQTGSYTYGILSLSSFCFVAAFVLWLLSRKMHY
ncbi:MAG TPA: hypothetical protein DCM08_04245 [Microscillaceae bacterium]|nr:hypothetical protein [Microscillaceae bacterium]